jgi:uncharacterized membrane protein
VAAAARNYVPLEIASKLKVDAWRAWAVGLSIAVLWIALILGAPIAKANGLNGVSSPLYTFLGFLCHQMDGRSFHIAGEKFGVCSRCFGVYFGIVVAFLAYPFWRRIENVDPLPKFWLFAACAPAAVDWSLTIFGIWENTYLSRLVTGGLLGFACGTFIVPSLVEISRNLALRRGTFARRQA